MSNGWVFDEYLFSFSSISLDIHTADGPNINAVLCNDQDSQIWKWNSEDGTVQSKYHDQCLGVQLDLEVWAGPLSDGSQAVLLLNRAPLGSESITVKWTDIGFPADATGTVRDLWAGKDLGSFTGSYTSPKLNFHSGMMLKVTPNK